MDLRFGKEESQTKSKQRVEYDQIVFLNVMLGKVVPNQAELASWVGKLGFLDLEGLTCFAK